MATTKAPESTAVATVEATDEKFTIDSKEISRVLSVIRYRLNEGVRDANRKSPFLSASQTEARAKVTASFRVLKEFAEQTF